MRFKKKVKKFKVTSKVRFKKKVTQIFKLLFQNFPNFKVEISNFILEISNFRFFISCDILWYMIYIIYYHNHQMSSSKVGSSYFNLSINVQLIDEVFRFCKINKL